MHTSRRVLVVVAAASAFVLTSSARANAQLAGYHSGSVNFAPVDAAALGDTLPASVGLFATANEYVAAGGVGAAAGALRGYAGGYPGYYGVRWTLGAGYARTFTARDLAGPLYGSFGSELIVGFRHMDRAPRDAGALRLTAPLGVSLGDPSGASLGIYAAPYAESAVMRRLVVPSNCASPCHVTFTDVGLQSAVGVGAGLRIALGRLSAELMFHDVGPSSRRPYLGDESAIGFTYRLGR